MEAREQKADPECIIGPNGVVVEEVLAPFRQYSPNPIWFRVSNPKYPDGLSSCQEFAISLAELAINGGVGRHLDLHNRNFNVYFYPLSRGGKPGKVEGYEAFYVELTSGTRTEQHQRLTEAPLMPSIRIDTNGTMQAYWLADGVTDLRDWLDIQWRLVRHFGSDPSTCDPSRPMLAPCFDKLTIGEDGSLERDFVVCASLAAGRRYTIDFLRSSFDRQGRPRPYPSRRWIND